MSVAAGRNRERERIVYGTRPILIFYTYQVQVFASCSAGLLQFHAPSCSANRSSFYQIRWPLAHVTGLGEEGVELRVMRRQKQSRPRQTDGAKVAANKTVSVCHHTTTKTQSRYDLHLLRGTCSLPEEFLPICCGDYFFWRAKPSTCGGRKANKTTTC